MFQFELHWGSGELYATIRPLFMSELSHCRYCSCCGNRHTHTHTHHLRSHRQYIQYLPDETTTHVNKSRLEMSNSLGTAAAGIDMEITNEQLPGDGLKFSIGSIALLSNIVNWFKLFFIFSVYVLSVNGMGTNGNTLRTSTGTGTEILANKLTGTELERKYKKSIFKKREKGNRNW